MPYTKRKTYTRRRRPVANKTVKRVARYEAKKVLDKEIETKQSDVSLAASSVDYTTGVVQALHTNLTVGTGANQFIGTRVHPIYLHIRYKITGSDTTNIVRIIVVQVRTAGTPTLANTLESVSNVRAPLSDYEVDYNHTYTVLFNRLVTVEGGNAPGAPTQRIGEIKIRPKRLRTMFWTAAGSIERGGIFFLAISDSGVAAHPTVEFYSRLHYKDA